MLMNFLFISIFNYLLFERDIFCGCLFLLEDHCFTRLHWFLLYNNVNQL